MEELLLELAFVRPVRILGSALESGDQAVRPDFPHEDRSGVVDEQAERRLPGMGLSRQKTVTEQRREFSAASHSPHILVVEDDLAILDLVALLLETQGYTVSRAMDGEQALEVFSNEKPDLIILDLMLPHVDGLSLCQRIRETSLVPIIILSARTQEEDMVWALDLGANDYLTKPFGARELLARVRATLRDTTFKDQDTP